MPFSQEWGEGGGSVYNFSLDYFEVLGTRFQAKIPENSHELPEKIFAEHCYETFEQFSDLWHTSSHLGFRMIR